MNGFLIFITGCFSCLFVAILFIQDRHNTALIRVIARRDAQTRALIRALGEVVRGQTWELAGAQAELVTAGDGAVYALVRLREGR